MRRVLRTRQAREDILDIWEYIAAEDISAADATLDALDEKCRLLAENPNLGPAREDIRPGLRYSVVGSYLVLYEVLSGGIKVVRVIHGRRDLFGLQLP